MTTAIQALNALREKLDDGLYAPGDQLPAERDLAVELGAGRGTLRKALEALEAEGRIRRRVGQGTFVTESAAIAALKLDALPTPADVMETRLMIEPAIAAAAAVRARPEQISALGALADNAERGLRVWETRDDAFHAKLAEASGNPLLVALIDTLRAMRAREDWSRLRKVSHTPDRRRAFLRQHVAVARAVAARDPKGAATAMREHLASVQSAMLEHPETLAVAARA
jgi:DNA-binding FadR family transcriptional regulator